jgi:hypothetical protein
VEKVDVSREQLLSQVKTKVEEKTLMEIKKARTIQSADLSLVELGKRLVQVFDEQLADDWMKITHVIIENQISPIANRMKTLQGMLLQYFILRLPPTTHLECVSSANKLRCPSLVTNHTLISSNNKYKDNKQNSVALGSHLLEMNIQTASWIPFVATHKKKDDLFDALLQGVAYMYLMKARV